MRFNLIVGFVNPNITEQVVETAKNSGATGEVIIQGKGIGIEPTHFLGLSILDKTDIILFVVEEHHTRNIMDAVSEECRIDDPGNGIMISLTIDRVAGLRKQIEQIRENLKTQEL